jgi:hypothetical protein
MPYPLLNLNAFNDIQEELDAKLAAMEAEISHGQLGLREEKQMVRDISKLGSQRERVRELEGRKGTVRIGMAVGCLVRCDVDQWRWWCMCLTSAAAVAGEWCLTRPPPTRRVRARQLAQLEAELSKVKAAIKELDTEVTSLKGERSQAVGILQEIQGKLRVSAGLS